MDFIVGGRGGTAEQTSFFMAVVFFQVCYFFSVFYCKVSSRFYGGHAFGTDICSFDGYVSFGLHGKAAFGGDGGAYIAGGAVMAVVIPVPCDGRVFLTAAVSMVMSRPAFMAISPAEDISAASAVMSLPASIDRVP